MKYFYNFNFDENKMYCMPIIRMSAASSNHRRWINIAKEHDTIPRTTNPYVEGCVTYKVHEFPEVVYKRCFWMEERDDEKAEKIRRDYLKARAKMEVPEMRRKEHDLKWELYQLRQRVDILEEHINNIDKAITNILKTQLNEVMLVNSIAEDVVKLMKEDKK